MIYNKKTVSEYIRSPLVLFALLIVLAITAYFFSKISIPLILLLISIPLIVVYFFYIVQNPSLGLITIVIFSFLIPGISRYLPGENKLGLIIDALLVLTYIACLFNGKIFKNKHHLIKIDLLLLSVFWMLYNILQLFNPYTAYAGAWFAVVRPIALYLLLALPLASMLIVNNRTFNIILIIWGIFSILGTIKAALQIYIGLDQYEQIWFNEVGYLTHFVNNHLRAFSFYTDAGQFGAAQGHAAVIGLIMATAVKNKRLKIFYVLMGLSGLYGMILSGTRGAVFVPYIAALAYVILRKNIRMALLALFLSAMAFGFLKFTYIGNQNYFIYRMRTAFDPNDASLQVRIENQRLFKQYLRDKPFGGGVGMAGYWGQHYGVDSPLARIATDSWYVQIWAEEGIIGLILYLSILIYILAKGSYIIMFRLKNEENITKMIALMAGLAGVAVASYGNNVIGQIPTSFLTYFSIAFIFGAQELENELNQKQLTS